MSDEPEDLEAEAGEPRRGEPRSGEPRAGEPRVGEPRAGEPRPGEPPEGAGGEEEIPEPERRRRRLERLLPQVFKRAIERGLESSLETLTNPGEKLRGVLDDSGRLPKELAGYLFAQVDETKNMMVRVAAHEIRDFLEATDLSKELQKALTALSFEIRTEIRFIPNDAGGVRPVVKAQVDPQKRRGGRRGEAPPDEEE